MLQEKINPRNIFIAFLSVSLLFFFGCQKKTDRKASEKLLRAFDFELLRQVNNMMQSKAVASFTPFFTLPNAPLPLFSSNVTDSVAMLNGYNLEKAKGEYVFNRASQSWDFTAPAKDAMPLKLSYHSENDSLVHLYVEEYSEAPIELQMLFPTRLKGELFEGSNCLMTLNYSAEVKNGFPALAELHISLNNYEIMFNLKTKFKGQSSAELNIDIHILESQKQTIHLKLKSDVAIGQNKVLTYNKLKLFIEAFPLVVKLNSEFDFASIGDGDFFDLWNRKTKTVVYSDKNQQLGKIYLIRNQPRDRAGLLIEYNDGSFQSLEEIMLVVQKVLDAKIHRLHSSV